MNGTRNNYRKLRSVSGGDSPPAKKMKGSGRPAVQQEDGSVAGEC